MNIESAIAKIDAWLKATKMPDSRLGLLSVANARAIERIRAGTARIDTLQAVLGYIADHPVK